MNCVSNTVAELLKALLFHRFLDAISIQTHADKMKYVLDGF